MSAEGKQKRRAPKGNQNASQPGLPEKAKVSQGKRRGFYSRVLDEAGWLDFELASGVNGIDDEIALLRVAIKSILEHEPENIKLIMEATSTLARLLKTRYDITKEQKKGFKEAISNVLRDVALPLGIGIGSTLNK